jgi:predicted small secreted protein
MIARIVLIAGLLAAGFGIAACDNTVHGFGQDTQNAGQGIKESVQPKPAPGP